LPRFGAVGRRERHPPNPRRARGPERPAGHWRGHAGRRPRGDAVPRHTT
jgi:hypothetical protein